MTKSEVDSAWNSHHDTVTVISWGTSDSNYAWVQKLLSSLNKESLQEIKQMENYKQFRYQDAVYFGQVLADTKIRDGRGIILYQNGRVCEGEWAEGRRQG